MYLLLGGVLLLNRKLAVGKMSHQMNDYVNTSDCCPAPRLPYLAVDGITSTALCGCSFAQTQFYSTNPWWIVDFGWMTYVGKVVITPVDTYGKPTSSF